VVKESVTDLKKEGFLRAELPGLSKSNLPSQNYSSVPLLMIS